MNLTVLIVIGTMPVTMFVLALAAVPIMILPLNMISTVASAILANG